jgi:hypothetical protein
MPARDKSFFYILHCILLDRVPDLLRTPHA